MQKSLKDWKNVKNEGEKANKAMSLMLKFSTELCLWEVLSKQKPIMIMYTSNSCETCENTCLFFASSTLESDATQKLCM